MTEPREPNVDAPVPRANAALLGHESAERTLLRAFGSGRLPHAWLITGARGIGKATLAYRFARFALTDQAGQGPDLFGGTPDSLRLDPADTIFQRVATGAHPDLRCLERRINDKTGKPRSEIVVEDVRAATNFLRMTSTEGGWRVVVVDSADELNANAANALLKVLEEPPAQALILLVSHAPNRLLPTIHSRCCHLAMAPLTEDLVVDLLGRYAPGLDETDRAALARLSEGSIGRALALSEGGGLELYREMIDMLSDLPRLDVPRAHAFGDRLARERDGSAFRTGMELIIWWLARLVRGGAEGRMPSEVVPGEGAVMARLLERRGLAQWLGLWEKTARLFARADRASLDRKQVVLTTLFGFQSTAS